MKCVDGDQPAGPLVQASNLDFYGVTIGGGVPHDATIHGGTVFQISPAGSFKTIHSFCGKKYCADGLAPGDGLVLAKDGVSLYGIAGGFAIGGLVGRAVLFRWFVGMNSDDAVWEVTVFTKNRERLLAADVAKTLFADLSVEIIEWPGCQPTSLDLDVSDSDFEKTRCGKLSVPLGDTTDLGKFGGLPWGSIVTLRHAERSLPIITGPAKYSKGWFLQALEEPDESATIQELNREAQKIRHLRGLESHTTTNS